jgi:hypothetical protein
VKTVKAGHYAHVQNAPVPFLNQSSILGRAEKGTVLSATLGKPIPSCLQRNQLKK